MKALFVLFTILTTTQLQGQAQNLTSAEKKALLSSLNQICGDSWCAGDFEYSFQDIDCKFAEARCSVDLSVQGHDELSFDEAGVEIDRREFPKRRYLCELDGLSTKAELLDPSGKQYSPSLYAALSDCIADSIAPVQNAIRFAQPLRAEESHWSLSRLTNCPSLSESSKPLSSEYAFTAEDKKDFALIAALDRAGLDAAANPSCSLKSYRVARNSIRCVSGDVPAFCELPLADGVFLVSKDYVDSTLVTFEALAKAPKSLPKTYAKNDSKKLYLPDPAACTESLLLGYTQESTVSWSSLSSLRAGFDLRFVVAQMLRERVKDLANAANDQSKCKFVPVELPATEMNCEAMAQGQLCTLKAAQGGYWRVYLSTNGRVSSFFHRYD